MKNWNNKLCTLMQINDDGFPEHEVNEGDELSTRDGEVWVVSQGVGEPPHKPSSTGRVWVHQSGTDFGESFFPGVFGCKWVES